VTLAWAARAVGPDARVVRVRRLRNAWSAAMHAIDIDSGDTRYALVLRRWTRVDRPPDDGVVENEAAVLELLRDSHVPAPRFVASDAAAVDTDVPALLMTRLPGRDLLAPRDLDAYLDRLAITLRAVHEAGLPTHPLHAYAPWNLDVVTEPPPWSRKPSAWTRAMEIAHGPFPQTAWQLCHRDFHPGNVLWARGRVAGVVDWTHACRGPAEVDVTHCRVNLAVLFGVDAARQFLDAYGAARDQAFFDCVGAIDASEIVDAPWRFHDGGRTDLTAALLAERLDAFVVDAVRRAS
jgi:Ser/Thr protein kinase RdoA (MazF antagonist)